MTVMFPRPYDFTSARMLPANRNGGLRSRKTFLSLGFPCVGTLLQRLQRDGTEDLVSMRSMGDLTSKKLIELSPDRIVAPLLALETDIIALAEFLETESFAGALTVIGPRLPKPHMVRREIQAVCPSIMVELYVPHRTQPKIGIA